MTAHPVHAARPLRPASPPPASASMPAAASVPELEEPPDAARVRRMRAQLLTVVACAVGMAVAYLVACALLY